MVFLMQSSTNIWHVARAVGVPVGRHWGSPLAITLVATINVIILLFFRFFFLLWSFLMEGVLRSKNLFFESWWEYLKTRRVGTFPDLSAILGPPSSYFGFYRLSGVAGGEQVPLAAPLGWFLCCICRYQYGLDHYPLQFGKQSSRQDSDNVRTAFHRICYAYLMLSSESVEMTAVWPNDS